MSTIHGKVTEVTLDSNNLTAFCNNVSFNRSADSHESTTFGNNSKTYVAGLKDATVTIEGIYDSSSSGPAAIIRPLIGGSEVDFVYMPEGGGSGNPRTTVKVIALSYEETSPVGDLATWSAELQCSGDITDTTIA